MRIEKNKPVSKDRIVDVQKLLSDLQRNFLIWQKQTKRIE